jgi:UDP-glucose 4-epimerase
VERGNVLVTGGAGYIGSHIVLELQSAGFGVVVYDDLSNGILRPMHERCIIVRGDVGDRRLVYETLARHDCIAVIHMAGSIVVPDSVRDPLDYYANNTTRSHALIQACVAYGIGAFIFSSTAAVYGVPEDMPVTETTPTLPINAYGASKLMSEQILRDTALAYDLPVSVLRYFNVAGADPDMRAGNRPDAGAHLVKMTCEVALGRRDHLQVFGTDYDTRDGTCVRDFIHVCDLASAHIAVLRHLLKGKDVPLVNCGYGNGFTVRDVVAAVERVSGRTIRTVDSPRRPGDPPVMIADSSLLRRELDWTPRFDDIDRIVGDSLRWMRHCDETEMA